MTRRTRWRPEDYLLNGFVTIVVFGVPAIGLSRAGAGLLGLLCAAGCLFGVVWIVLGVVLKLVEIAERDE